MSDLLQTSDSNKDHQAQDIGVSGGINVHGGHTSVDGDLVAHDKITHNTWNNIRQFVMQPWAWIGGAVILVIGLVLIAGIFNVTQLRSLLPTPMAFPPAKEGESLILVTDFDDRSGGKYQGIDPAQYIYEQLTAQAKKDNLTVRVERLRRLVDDSTVRQTGEAFSATLVLWGWYDALAITPRLERIKTRSKYQSTEEGKHLTLADPTKVEFTIITDLPSQSAYIVFLALGLETYARSEKGDDDAIKYFNSALSSIPIDVPVTAKPTDAYFFRGNAYIHKGDYDRALVDYDHALRLEPDYANAYINRGNIYNRNGDYDRAIADYDNALRLKPDLAEAHYNRGNTYNRNGDHDRAIADYDQALRLNPDWAEVYSNRGVAYYDKGDYDRALADYDQALKLNPDNAEAHNNRGNIYNRNGDYDRAIADYDHALKLNPDYAKWYYNRGSAYIHKGDYDHAIADYDQALKLEPNWAEVYYNRGVAYYDKDDYDRAIADYDQALKLNPDYAEAYNNRGNSYDLKGNSDRAIADYDQALKLKPDYAEAYYNRGIAYKFRGEQEKAIADFRKVLEVSSNVTLRQKAEEQLKALCVQ